MIAEQPAGARWYVIATISGHEFRTKRNLEMRIESMGMAEIIHTVTVPTETEIQVRGGQRTPVQRKLWDGYVLVQMREITDDELSNRAWFVVRNTPGVTGFCGGDVPTPLAESEVKAILRQTETEAPKKSPSFVRGESVRIIDGPFAEFIGVVQEVSATRNAVKVLVEFFGRETPVELDFLQVERVSE